MKGEGREGTEGLRGTEKRRPRSRKFPAMNAVVYTVNKKESFGALQRGEESWRKTLERSRDKLR